MWVIQFTFKILIVEQKGSFPFQMPGRLTRLVSEMFLFHWERDLRILNSKRVSAICALTLRTRAFGQSVKEPFLFGHYLKFREKTESQPRLKSLTFKTQAKK